MHYRLQVAKLVAELQAEDIFAREVDSSGIPFHSPAMQKVREPMLAAMRTAVAHAKPRSSRWISSSIPESEWESELAHTWSA